MKQFKFTFEEIFKNGASDTFSEEIGDEPDESYYNNGPE
jgi:hypothetical protein